MADRLLGHAATSLDYDAPELPEVDPPIESAVPDPLSLLAGAFVVRWTPSGSMLPAPVLAPIGAFAAGAA